MGMKLKQLQHLSTLVTIRCHQSEMKNKSFLGRGDQGGRSWLAFGEGKIIPQSFRRARICKFWRQKRRFLQLHKYW